MIIIVYHLTTLCVHHIFPFMFTFMFQFVSFSFSIIIFMFHEHINTFFIFYIFLVSCLLHMALHILVKYDVKGITPHSYIVFLYEFNLLRKWNQSNRIIPTKVMAFLCQLINLSITLGTVCITNFFPGTNFIFDTIPLYSFKAKVLRVLFQLESPNSEHRNSSYVRNNPDYSMSKTDAGIFLAHGPTLSEFLGHL